MRQSTDVEIKWAAPEAIVADDAELHAKTSVQLKGMHSKTEPANI